jgi:Bacterial Ig domain
MFSGKEFWKCLVIGILVLLIGCNMFKKKDKIPPVVDITVPQDSMWFSGPLKITVTAYDSVGVESVLIYGDDNWISTDTTTHIDEPYTFSWQLQNQSPFSWHSIFAKGYDKAQNEGISQTIPIFYLGRQEISLYHGTAIIPFNDYFDIDFSAEIGDSLYGSTLVNNQDSLANFYLLDNTNFDKFKKTEAFSPILSVNNFKQMETSYYFNDSGSYYLVWQNSSGTGKSVWIRFYLSRP